MNVSGIRPYEGFYQYNSIKLNELRNQQIAASAKAAEQANGVEDTAQKKEEQEEEERAREFLPREKKEEGGYLSVLLREPGRVGFVCPFRAPDSEKNFQAHEL